MSKVLAVGDIHTKTWIIDAVAKIADDYDEIVFVGDYADDWNKQPDDTIAAWRALKEFQDANKEKTHLVIGNHDYIYLHNTSTISSGYNRITQLLLNAKDNAELKQWLYTIPAVVYLNGVTYSHAGVTNTFEYECQGQWELWKDDSPIWARPNYSIYRDMPQVFGHTPSETCWEVQPNVWCIDTFSTHRDGTPFGDQTVLEVVDGKTFTPIKLI